MPKPDELNKNLDSDTVYETFEKLKHLGHAFSLFGSKVVSAIQKKVSQVLNSMEINTVQEAQKAVVRVKNNDSLRLPRRPSGSSQ